MTEEENDKIPLFSSWNHWYRFIIIFLAILIVLFYLFTKHFA